MLWYMCRGYENPEIAEILEVSTHTAKAHVAAILRKFGVKTRAAVTYIAGKNYMV
ncbi:MAG: helix-turn-helix transcriptional regulator [Candidatus Gastranaerophilaceae bacterium]